jgi:hypothetical protein
MHPTKTTIPPTVSNAFLDKLLLDVLKESGKSTPSGFLPCVPLTSFVEMLRSRVAPFRRLDPFIIFVRVRSALKRLEAEGFAECVDETWTVSNKGARN